MKLNSTSQEISKPGSSAAGFFPILFTNIAGVHIAMCPLSFQPRFSPGHAYTMNSSFTRPGTKEMNLSTNGSALQFVTQAAYYTIVHPDHPSGEDIG